MTDVRADRHDIGEVLVRYTTGIDRRDWALLKTCFTDDAVAEYQDVGTWNDADALVAFMEEAHAAMGHSMHRVSNFAIEVDGDTATARCYVDSLNLTPDGQSGIQTVGFYDDDLVRTADGWRISRRAFTPVLYQAVGG
jgi:3-phenylpropionate/cinnamic acid dioxygenase small subunit